MTTVISIVEGRPNQPIEIRHGLGIVSHDEARRSRGLCTNRQSA